MSGMLGPLLVLVFALSQALRDVYFGNLFQGVDFVAVIFIAFLLSTVIFTAVTLVKSPGEFAKLWRQPASVLAMNITTAVAWSSYFFALTQLEPSIVNTIHSAMGPLTVVLLGAFGIRLAKPGAVGRMEAAGYAGIALSVIGLWWVVLAGYSGLPEGSLNSNLAGLALLSLSGTSITLSLLYSRRLHDHGVNALAVTAVRYLVLIALAGGVLAYKGGFSGIETGGQLATLAMTTTVLIILPLFALQVGVARTVPLTAHIIRALGPVFVFALEQFDSRMHYAPAALACIVVYSVAVVWSNVARGWRETPTAIAPNAQTPPVPG